MDRMASSAAEAGHSVSVISSGVCARKVGKVELKTVSEVVRSRKWYPILWVRCIVLALKDRADVYHIHEVPLMLCGVVLKLLGKRVVVDFHEDFEAELFEKPYLGRFFMWLFYIIYQPFKWLIIPLFDHVIIAEDSYQHNFAHVCNKRSTVRNHPRVEKFRYVDSPGGESFRLLYVGAISEDRGCRNIVEAVKEISLNNDIDIDLTLIGRIPDEGFRQYIENEKLASGGTIIWNGPQPYSEIQNLMTDYSLGFSALHDNPNYRASLPTKILEYNSAGLMCIASDLPITAKYVVPDFTGLIIRPNNTADLTEAIINLFKNSRYPDREKIRNWVLTNYSWEREFSILQKVYSGLK